jgi:DMSO/TMAO reductase YedYZ molybdopterin-dependent catalytic subunit
MSRSIARLALIVIAISLLAACTPAAAPGTGAATQAQAPTAVKAAAGSGAGAQAGATAPQGTTTLKISGKVDKEISWSEDQVRAMPTAQSSTKNQKGESSSYTGVSISALLSQAKVQAGATKLVFTGEGGATAEAEWQKVQACADCLLSFRNRGGFSLVMPGFADGVQVKGLTSIEVK